jgi:hypothetical protein
LGFAEQLQQKAATSGFFAFPPIIDVKIDQPQSEVVFDRDKVAELGLDLALGGQDRFGRHGRKLRQPLQPGGPQLQGHPAGQARPIGSTPISSRRST